MMTNEFELNKTPESIEESVVTGSVRVAGDNDADLNVSETRAPVDVDSLEQETKVDSRVSDDLESERSGDGKMSSFADEVRVYEEESDGAAMDFEIEHVQSDQLNARVEQVERMESGTDGSDLTPRASVDGFDARNDAFESSDDQEGVSPSIKSINVGEGSQYDSMLSKFDDYVANGGVAKGPKLSLEPGEMVWGKVKSHPWWPGHIFSEALVSSSVRRTKREGHVLVAFFGDSSYGWFDPSELVPFYYNFTEKLRQTNMRNFVKAVEEALDEASRRCSLGLTCRCRNPYNFRPADVQGHFIVDVGDYAGGIYSEIQIEKARDSFQPVETLAFIRQLAMAPYDNDQKSIESIINTAKVFSYRKAVYEEFDETYGQAFGYAPDRSSPKNLSKEPMKQALRAPLSGPMVIAEALGGGRSSTKPTKIKEHSKKDKYLFKRRDEQNSSTNPGISEEQPTSADMGGTSATDTRDFILQQRDAPVIIKPQIVKHEKGASASGQKVIAKKNASLEKKPMVESDEAEIVKDEKGNLDDGSGSKSGDVSKLPIQTIDNFKQEGDTSVKTAQFHEDHQQPKPKVSLLGKVKVLKRSIGDLGPHLYPQGEKKKKKKEKDFVSETSLDQKQKRSATGKKVPSIGKLARTSIPIDGISFRLNSVQDQKKNEAVDLKNLDLELPQLLSDLQILALDPFHGSERNSPAVTRHAFLRFRSLVFQKSSSVDIESTDDKFEAGHRILNHSASEEAKDLPTRKPPRSLGGRPDDPTKGGRKRGPSDRQEEIAVKKQKKFSDLKSLAAEKKNSMKAPEAPRIEGKETTAATLAPKPSRPVPVKKQDSPARVVDPTMLVMKFPSGTKLPSGTELKARFTRFGPLDHDSTRIFWKSSTCRVVYRYKMDAQKAYKYAVGNKSVFGNANVRYFLRDSAENPDSGNNGDFYGDIFPARDGGSSELRPPPPPQLQAPVQLKSCLKRLTGDEVSGNNGGGNGRGTPRVKFMLGSEVKVEESSKNNIASFADGASSSSSIGMDFNSNNFQKVISSQSLPILPVLPLPVPQFVKPPQNMHFSEASSRVITLPQQNSMVVDISQPMLNLLTRCSDVVSSVKSILGYVPYHPL